MIEQGHAQEVEEGAGQADQQIAHGRRQGIGVTGQRHQGHRGQAQQFQGDVEIENIRRQEEDVQGGPEKTPQRPEGGRLFPAKVGTGVDADSQAHHGGHCQHQEAQSIGLEIDAKGCLPAAQRMAQYTVLHHLPSQADHRGGDRHAGEEARQDTAPRPQETAYRTKKRYGHHKRFQGQTRHR